MTYTLKTTGADGTQQEAVETAEQAAEKIEAAKDHGKRVKVHIDSEAENPEDFTESERLILIKQGELAADEGQDAKNCPYRTDADRRAAWMQGYQGRKPSP